METSKKLKKELNLLQVYAIATGTTLSAGFFLLPGLAYSQAGPAMIFSYMIAALPLIPAMFSMVELSTAMPRAGGAYYFLDRSMGPLVGTIGGLGTWLALILKTAFALIGMGAYVRLFWPDIPVVPLAVGFAMVFGVINFFGAKKSGSFQVLLVGVLLTILAVFLGKGLPNLTTDYFEPFFETGFTSILSTAGLVYISYVGVTKIASVAEEIENPVRNLPLGVFMAIGTSILIYGVGTTVMVGVVAPEDLKNNLTPVATAAEILFGPWGKIILTVAAIVAFSSVVNAGILSASRYPLAMSRDNLLPSRISKLNKGGTPIYSIGLTLGLIFLLVIAFDPTKIAKLASAFQLLMFALICFAVIVMRESKIESYDPGYLSPFYPWTQIFGVLSPFWLIIEMGWLPTVFSLALIGFGIFWYFFFAQKRVVRSGAIFHLFARLGELRFEGLDSELRGILKEKGLRKEDPFDELILRSTVIDLGQEWEFESMIHKVSIELSQKLSVDADMLETGFLEGSRIGATPVSGGAALPHLRLPNIERSEMVLVRCSPGSYVLETEGFYDNPPSALTYAFFFLVSPNDNPGLHLRILAQIAGCVDDAHFMREWLQAEDKQALKETLFREGRFVTLELKAEDSTEVLVGKELKDLGMPQGSLITSIRRRGRLVVPRGNTTLELADLLTIIGDAKGIKSLSQQYEVEIHHEK